MKEEDKALTKMGLRRLILTELRQLAPAEKASRSEQITEHLYQFLGLKSGQFVAFFAGAASEPNLMPLCIRYWQEGVRVAMLAIDEADFEMQAYEVQSPNDLFLGGFGVMEPVQNPAARVEVADMAAFLVPGVAFHPITGMRLGRGKGYYDRYLPRASSAPKIGVAFALQLCPDVVGEAHDQAMTHLFTEQGGITI